VEERDKEDTRDEDRRDGLLDIAERCGIVSAVNPREKHGWEDEEHTEHSLRIVRAVRYPRLDRASGRAGP